MSDPRKIDRTYFAAEGMTACVAIPLASHGRLVGVLSLVARRPEDLGATEVEIAIESARLYADAERRRSEAQTLADVVRDLAECHDLDTILERIARGANALCAADVTSLAVRDAGVCSRPPRSFSDADESVLVRLADHAATAIHNNRLFAAEQAARTEAQRSAQDFGDLVDTLDAIVLDADASKVKGWASRPTRRPSPQTTTGGPVATRRRHSRDTAGIRRPLPCSLDSRD